MADDTQRPIIIKRIKKSGSAAHGGAWKIAYADFVTAMMAFFLLMWLLGSTTKAQMEGIAEYFKTPLKVALTGGSGAGDATSIIKGGGTDLTRKTGQVMKSEDAKKKTVISLDKSKSEKEEKARLQDMKAKLDKLIEQNAKLKPYKNQLKIDMTDEGLRIQIVDDKNRPMFDSGGAAMKPYTREILQAIGKTLNELPNRISLSGHTDAVRYTTGERGYSNWELSADRAIASRTSLRWSGRRQDHAGRRSGFRCAIQQGQRQRPGQPPHVHHRDEQEGGRGHHPRGRKPDRRQHRQSNRDAA